MDYSRKSIIEFNPENFIKMWNEGYSIEDIAKKFHVPKVVVFRCALKNIDFVENDNDEFYKIIVHSTDDNLEIYVDGILNCIEKIIVGGDFKVYQQIKQYINSLVPTKKIKINSSMFEN